MTKTSSICRCCSKYVELDNAKQAVPPDTNRIRYELKSDDPRQGIGYCNRIQTARFFNESCTDYVMSGSPEKRKNSRLSHRDGEKRRFITSNIKKIYVFQI